MILKEKSIDKLSEEVNFSIKEDWAPQVGVFYN